MARQARQKTSWTQGKRQRSIINPPLFERIVCGGVHQEGAKISVA